MPIPDLSNKPGPGRPGHPTGGSYEFKFEVAGLDPVIIKANAASNTGSFRISWPNGTTQELSGNNTSVTAPDATEGIVSINNEKLDTTYMDEFAVVGNKTAVTKVISWGNNNWSNMTSAFQGCTNLTELPSASNIFKAGSASLSQFIHSCTGLTELDMTGWDLSSGTGTNLYYFAFGCTNMQKIVFKNKDVKLSASTPRLFEGVGTNVSVGCEFDMEGLNFTGTCNDMNTWFITARAKVGSNFSNWRFNQSVTNLSLVSLFNQLKFVDTSAVLNMSGWTDCNAINLSSMFTGAGGVDRFTPIDAINITGLRTNDTTTMYRMFKSAKMSRIIGLNNLVSDSLTGTGVAEMFQYCDRIILKDPSVTPTENFSNSFGSNWSITSVANMFDRLNEHGDLDSEYSHPPNLTGFNLSNVTNYAGFAIYNELSAPYDLSSVTFPTSAISLQGSFNGQKFTPTSDFTFDFTNVTINVSNFQRTFENNQCNRYKFGSNVNFSNNTTFYQTFKYSGMPPRLGNGDPSYRQIRVEFPTNANFGSVTTMNEMFFGQYGGSSNQVPFSNCQADNFIRIIYGTAFSNNLTVDLLNSQVTEAPSLVQSKLQELTTGAGGWSITVNSTDATMPFAYTGSFLTGTNITPTINTSGGTFSSSDVTVNANTGTFNTSTAGSVTIKYTLPNGCYNEQVLSVVPPFRSFKFRVTGPISIKAQPAVAGQSFTIDWGDGSTPVSTPGGASIPSNFTTAGTYDVQINASGDNTYCDEFAIVSGQTNVTKVLDWGEKPWSNMTNAFSGCTSLSDIGTTSFISSTQGDMVTMFNGCTSLLEADIRNWDLTAGADWAEGGPFKGLVNLQKLNATGLNVKLINQANKAFNGIGTAVTDGCEFLMSGFNISTSTIANSSLFFGGCRIAPTSNFSNWVFNPSGFDGTSMFNSAVLTGANSTLNCSGWSTYSGSQLPRFNSFNYNFANSNATQLFPGTKIDFTDLNVSSVNYMVSIYYYTGISEIIGLNTWGATAGNVNMSGMFEGSSYLKFSDSDNFNSTFVNSLTPSNFDKVFFRNGDALTSNYGVAPNIANIDVSNCVSLSQTFKGLRCTNVPAINTATFPSTAISLHQLFHNARFISSSETHVDFSNTTIKINSKRQMFSSTWVDKVTFGDNVDFSALTDVYNMCYYMNGSNPDGTTTELTYPTNANFSSLTTTAGWFNGLQGPTTGPLTTCQIDNLIRSFRVTAYNNALNVNFYQSQITEAPSVVRTLEAELVANGWTITENATDATIPFQYGTGLEPDTTITPTNNTGSAFTGTFTSSNSNIAINSSTGVINTPNGGNTTIRYTLADGCFTEQEIVIESPMLSVWRTTTPSESVAIVGQSLGNTDEAIYYDFTVDWGDSTTVESYSGTPGKNISHTYVNAGDYEVKISGKYPGLVSNANADRVKLIEFKQWGTCIIRAFPNMFNGCTNMTYTATDSPTWNNSLTTRGFDNVFRDCSSITSLNLSNWSSSMLGYAWNNLYARNVFNGCTNVEQITLPTGINADTIGHDSMFQGCGTATAGGVEITWTNYTNGRTNGLSLNNLMYGTKIKFANLTYWSISGASTQYIIRSNPDVVGNYLDMSNWTTTGNGLGNFYLRSGKVDEVRINNWNANMTQNIGSLSHAWYATDVEKIIGLENWNFNGVTTMLNWLVNVSKLSFSTGRNFGTNSMTSGNLQILTSAFNSVGAGLSTTQQADSYAPNISNWNTSSVTSFGSVFYNVVFNLSDVDVSNWDFSSATSLGVMFRRYNRSANSRGTRTFEVVISSLSSSCTSLGSMCRESAVTDIDLRGSDLSSITSLDHFWLGSYAPSGHIKRFRIDTNADLSSVSNMGNFSGTIHTDDYDLLLTRLEATNNNTGVSMAMSSSKYSAGLIFPDVRTRSMTDSTTANKIVDENADFVELGVSVNDIVETRNGNNFYYAKVSAVVSSTELTLDANIVASGRTYNVQTSNVAKARYDLDVTQSWGVSDGGPVIE